MINREIKRGIENYELGNHEAFKLAPINYYYYYYYYYYCTTIIIIFTVAHLSLEQGSH